MFNRRKTTLNNSSTNFLHIFKIQNTWIELTCLKLASYEINTNNIIRHNISTNCSNNTEPLLLTNVNLAAHISNLVRWRICRLKLKCTTTYNLRCLQPITYANLQSGITTFYKKHIQNNNLQKNLQLSNSLVQAKYKLPKCPPDAISMRLT